MTDFKKRLRMSSAQNEVNHLADKLSKTHVKSGFRPKKVFIILYNRGTKWDLPDGFSAEATGNGTVEIRDPDGAMESITGDFEFSEFLKKINFASSPTTTEKTEP